MHPRTNTQHIKYCQRGTVHSDICNIWRPSTTSYSSLASISSSTTHSTVINWHLYNNWLLSGSVNLTFSHWSMHLAWNSWAHGSTRTSWCASKSYMQTTHRVCASPSDCSLKLYDSSWSMSHCARPCGVSPRLSARFSKAYQCQHIIWIRHHTSIHKHMNNPSLKKQDYTYMQHSLYKWNYKMSRLPSKKFGQITNYKKTKYILTNRPTACITLVYSTQTLVLESKQAANKNPIVCKTKESYNIGYCNKRPLPSTFLEICVQLCGHIYTQILITKNPAYVLRPNR